MAFLRGSSIYCITEKEIKTSTREAFSYICISTATISSFGATVQLVNWYKKLRLSETRRVLSPAARVVFSLALADLFTCLGAIAMSILFLKFEPAKMTRDGHVEPAHHYYIWIGLPIEYFTMFSYIVSYMWTLFYSVDVCLRAHDLQSSFSGKIYHMLSWPLAAWLVACVQFAVYYSDPINCSPPGPIALLHYLVCYIPLLLVMICLPIVYWKAYRKVSQNIRNTGYFTDAERKLQKSIRRKFCYIIVVFIFCWLPNFCDGFHDIAGYISSQKEFFQDSNHSFLWLIEASVNPLQGFLNCLVYGQDGQFISCFNHIQNLFHSNDPPVDGNHQEQNLTWTINSLSGSVKIPVTEISPLLAGSRRSTPVLSTPTSNTPSQREPFHAKLLGEFSHSTKLQ